MLSITLILVLSSLCTAVQYTVWVKTADAWTAGTDDAIAISVLGSGSDGNWVRLGKFDETGRDDNERTTLYDFGYDRPSWMVRDGNVECIKLFTDGEDAWLVEWVSVTVTWPKKFSKYFYNTDQTWMSTDDSEGVSTLTLCHTLIH